MSAMWHNSDEGISYVKDRYSHAYITEDLA
jgi:hypothetical protein